MPTAKEITACAKALREVTRHYDGKGRKRAKPLPPWSKISKELREGYRRAAKAGLEAVGK